MNYLPTLIHRPSSRLAAISLLLTSGLIPPTIAASAEGDITAVSSRVSEDYIRTKNADGTYPREFYAFGPGGLWNSSMRDASIDKLKFIDVARTIALPLADKNYLPSKDPAQTKLLIMVYWGTTAGTKDSVAVGNFKPDAGANLGAIQQAAQSGSRNTAATGGGLNDASLAIALASNRWRDIADAKNASMLGYDSEGVIGTDYGRGLRLTALHVKVDDLVEEIEDNRYFVVLMAYDFQLMWKEKKHKLLWETRYSLRQRGNNFDEQLAAMSQYASRYFGQSSNGLVRKPLPKESVRLDELKILGVEPEKK